MTDTYVHALAGTGSGGSGITDLSGDVVATGPGSVTATIQPNAVTYAKIQEEGAATLLGNPTGSTADVQEITLGTGLSFSGSTLNATGGGSGTVTSVAVTVPGGLSVSGSPITTSGTIDITTNLTAGSVLFSDGTNIAQDNANLNWNDSTKSLTVVQPSTVLTENTVVTITSDPSGAHGHGAHLAIDGNPGGGGTIFRTDGGANRSWLQLYAGGYDGSQGGQVYINGNNSTDGDAGGVQVALGVVDANFQVLDANYNNLFGVTSTNITSPGSATYNFYCLNPSTAVVLDGSSNLINSTTTATELSYVHGVTSSIQTQINALAGQTPSQNQYYWVGTGGNDGTGNGTYNQPFATIMHAMGLITDASANKRYIIKIIGSKLQEPTNIVLKSYVYICGDHMDGTYIRINGGSGFVVPDATTIGYNGGSRCGLENIYLGGGTGINWDLYDIGPNTGTPSNVFVLNNVTVTGNFTFKGRTPGIDYLENFTGYFFGTNLLDACQNASGNSSYQGPTTLSSTNGLSNSNYQSCFFYSGLSITASSSYANTEQFAGCSITGGNLIINDSGSHISITSDSASYPVHAHVTITGTPTITFLNDTYSELYTPTTPGNWSVVPTTAQQGLDYLAAKPASTYFVNEFTLSPTDISNKYVTLTQAPAHPTLTILNVITGPVQNYSIDYTISSTQLSWSGLGLASLLDAGDQLIVQCN